MKRECDIGLNHGHQTPAILAVGRVAGVLNQKSNRCADGSDRKERVFVSEHEHSDWIFPRVPPAARNVMYLSQLLISIGESFDRPHRAGEPELRINTPAGAFGQCSPALFRAPETFSKYLLRPPGVNAILRKSPDDGNENGRVGQASGEKKSLQTSKRFDSLIKGAKERQSGKKEELISIC